MNSDDEELLGEISLDVGLKAVVPHDMPTSVDDRLNYSFEKFIGRTREHRRRQELSKDRLESLEALIGSFEKRADSLDKLLVESADTHGEHAKSMETRLESLEAVIEENAVKHAKEIEVVKESLAKELLKGHLASVEQRVNSLEKSFIESADTLEVSMKIRLESLEALIGESAVKHAREIEAAKEKLEYLDKGLANGAKHDQLARVEKRINSFEISLFESSDKLSSSERVYGEHEKDMKFRLDFLEGLIKETLDKHAKDIEAAKEKLEYFAKAIVTSLRASDQLASGEKRMNSLEKSLIESVDMLKSSQEERDEPMKIRLDFLEKLIGDHADVHAMAIEASNEKLRNLGTAMAGCAKHDHLVSIEERIHSWDNFVNEAMASRLESLEALIGENKDKHEKEIEAHMDSHRTSMQNLKIAHRRHEESMKTHFESLETLIVDTAASTSTDFLHMVGGLEKTLVERMNFLECHMADSAKHDHLASVEERLCSLESAEPEERICRLETSLLESQSPDKFLERFLDLLDRAGAGRSNPSHGPESSSSPHGHTRRRLDYGDGATPNVGCLEFSPRKALANLLQDFQGGSAPKESRSLFGNTPDSASFKQQPEPPEGIKNGHQLGYEMQVAEATAIDIDTLEWVPAHRMDSNLHIVGNWSYVGGSFRIDCLSDFVNLPSDNLPTRLYFTQCDFTGELKPTGDWLQVHIPCAKGSVRMQIDRTESHLQVQFKRVNESKWRRKVCAKRQRLMTAPCL